MTSVRVDTLRLAPDAREARDRVVPDETPIALVHDGSTHAVMMATPADLEDFAVGFSLSEGVIADPSDIRDLDIVEHDEGFELRMWLAPNMGRVVVERRRLIAGPTGCGLCGVESLQAACAPARLVQAGGSVRREDVVSAMDAMSDRQSLGHATRATHAAGFWRRGEGLIAVREDVGRHNALDKLIGFTAREKIPTADGIVVITSRVSIEMVQKTAVLGAPVLAAISAPTALAVRTAEAAGITLAAIVRGDTFEVFTHPHRIPAPEPATATA
ncbi:formate dehydrogenase accessory sulfurtransferase FdhD [Chthonobacter rhizosphaerae]|uniref:formate dehydrogenase accessory sulfurtransferase FdhD n=1 Tax=Chthonobacter rhizosphaerae TaxID=2735553 RepID=UPI0015EFB7AB|nr:formate dehydrogenase accessory sulfurtransferase FdhD [Chthonobacter rhizosphaerae]